LVVSEELQEKMMSYKKILICLAMAWVAAGGLQASPKTHADSPAVASTTVRGRVEVAGAPVSIKKRRGTTPTTVVWLTATGDAAAANLDPPNSSVTPASSGPASSSNSADAAQVPRLVQRNKSFDPHVLVVQAGSMVEFPNRDPFFHNVFSLFEGKRFDLGLYEAGTTRMVRFDRPGISYIFCNIHPEMSAVVITIATRFYSISNAEGQLSMAGVPYGRYILHVWSEGMGPENTQPLTREITIGENVASLGVIRVPPVDGQHMAHKNKYGRDYDTPAPNSSVYEQQQKY
jgi:plastocyanin